MTWSPPAIPLIDRALEPRLRALIDGKAKPPGSLGRIEDLSVQLGLIQDRTDPRIAATSVLVFAGDHGLVEAGVSAYPQAVTAAMVGLFLSGQATVTAFAKAADVAVKVIDAGVAADLGRHDGLIDAKVAKGTRNAAEQPAMTAAEARQVLDRGVALARAEAADAVALGEMGIGNTASASLIMHRLAPADLDACIGQGAGHDADGMVRKRAALHRAAARSDVVDPFAVLSQFGGFEIAMMAGAVLGAASARKAVVVDGFIATAAALVAIRMAPAARDYCIFAHGSAEAGHRAMLRSLDAEPLLDLGMRLGEGTGAVLAMPLLRAAARLVTDVANLSDVVGP